MILYSRKDWWVGGWVGFSGTALYFDSTPLPVLRQLYFNDSALMAPLLARFTVLFHHI